LRPLLAIALAALAALAGAGCRPLSGAVARLTLHGTATGVTKIEIDVHFQSQLAVVDFSPSPPIDLATTPTLSLRFDDDHIGDIGLDVHALGATGELAKGHADGTLVGGQVVDVAVLLTGESADGGAQDAGTDLALSDLAGADLALSDLAPPDLAEADLALSDLAGADLALPDLAGPVDAGPDLSWTTQVPAAMEPLTGIWGSGPTDIYAVDKAAGVSHSGDGKTWQIQNPNATGSFSGVGGFAANDVYAVGQLLSGGQVYHFDGSKWTALLPLGSGLNAVTGLNATNVWLAGDGPSLYSGPWGGFGPSPTPTAVMNKDILSAMEVAPGNVFCGLTTGWIIRTSNGGGMWTAEQPPNTNNASLYGIWGSAADDVWVVGGQAYAAHFDGAVWTTNNFAAAGGNLRAAWGRATDDVYVVGDSGIWHFDGLMWTRVYFSNQPLYAAWGPPGGGIYAVGGAGQAATIVYHP
jgi:hypothetical protein